jgi:hypothetical protein|tara:strand:+ start:608 stop:766 length:159 start_codon:yes stop_codon:yes gene_type:complete
MSVQYVSYNVISSAKAESKVSPTPPSIASNGINRIKLFNRHIGKINGIKKFF